MSANYKDNSYNPPYHLPRLFRRGFFVTHSGHAADPTSGIPEIKNGLELDSAGLPIGYAYEYDLNGNLTFDGLRGLNIEYNFLNLTSGISREADGTHTQISYLADGTKLSTTTTDADGHTSTLSYLGSFTYFRDSEDAPFEVRDVRFSGGRLVKQANGDFDVVYHVTDHLGSVRAQVGPGGPDGPVVSHNEYYPFGKMHADPERPRTNEHLNTLNDRRFNGKEAVGAYTPGNAGQDYGYLDFGARLYDPETARWTGPDPLAGDYSSFSPYSFALDNPARFIDPNGMDVWEITDLGEIKKQIEDKTQDAFHIEDDAGNRINGLSKTFKPGTIATEPIRFNVKVSTDIAAYIHNISEAEMRVWYVVDNWISHRQWDMLEYSYPQDLPSSAEYLPIVEQPEETEIVERYVVPLAGAEERRIFTNRDNGHIVVLFKMKGREDTHHIPFEKPDEERFLVYQYPVIVEEKRGRSGHLYYDYENAQAGSPNVFIGTEKEALKIK